MSMNASVFAQFAATVFVTDPDRVDSLQAGKSVSLIPDTGNVSNVRNTKTFV